MKVSNIGVVGVVILTIIQFTVGIIEGNDLLRFFSIIWITTFMFVILTSFPQDAKGDKDE